MVSGRSLYAWLDRAGETAGHYATGLFRMSSFVPGQTYRIFFIQDDRHLAGLADLTARSEPADPVRVTLGKMATVRGKVLRPDGSPDRGKRISLQILMAREEMELDPMFFFGDNVLSYGLAAQSQQRLRGLDR